MKPQRVLPAFVPWLIQSGTRALYSAVAAVACVSLLSGCKSDLNQQLLERELRYQEDQIYQLQDELAERQARLSYVAGENASLRKQLGVSDFDNATPSRGQRSRSPGVAPATTVPPAIKIPEGAPRSRGPVPRGSMPPIDLAPPTLEGVPPLPDEPGPPGRSATDTGEGLSLPPATAAIDPAARPIESAESIAVDAAEEEPPPALVRISYDEPAAGGEAVRLAVNPTGSAAIDVDRDGQSEGLSLAIEPRNSGERLSPVNAAITVTAYDGTAAAGEQPLARWTVPADEVASRFRPAGRRRGLVFDLPWQGTLPAGDHVRVTVAAETPSGMLETEALVRVR
jgi:hypothetical protein